VFSYDPLAGLTGEASYGQIFWENAQALRRSTHRCIEGTSLILGNREESALSELPNSQIGWTRLAHKKLCLP